MAKLIVLKGYPGSGKSTMAKSILANDKNAVRVNKDSLREMCYYSEYSPKREEVVDNAEFLLIDSFLAKGRTVIVDDTNLNGRDDRIKARYRDKHDVEIMHIETPVEECIKRDSTRCGNARVGRSVITNMAIQNGYTFDKPVVIVDIDGTIADCSHHLRFIQTSPKDWEKFFSNAEFDEPRMDVIRDIHTRYPHQDFAYVMVSGRPDSIRKPTEHWLEDYFPHYNTLLMRRARDRRDDQIVKAEIYNKYLAQQNVVAVFDDRPRVLRTWEDIGIPEINDVGPGKEF